MGVFASSGIISTEFLNFFVLQHWRVTSCRLFFLTSLTEKTVGGTFLSWGSKFRVLTWQLLSSRRKIPEGRVASSGTFSKGVLGFICPLGRRDAFRWAKKENCKSTCKSALNAEKNSQKLQSESRVTVWRVSSRKVFKCKACYHLSSLCHLKI